MARSKALRGQAGTLLARVGETVPLDLRAFSLAAGLRAGFACSVPLLLAEALNRPELSWVAIVAFWICLADPGGAWRTRLAALGAFTLCATLGIFLAVLVRPHFWPAVGFALVWCFAASFARIWGNAAASVGTLASVAVLVALGLRQPSGLGPAVQLAGLTLAGAAWAMLLALVVWRQHPYAPARRAVAAVWHALAAYARALAELHRPGVDDAAWDRVARERRRACREAVEEARRMLVATWRQRFGRSERGLHLLLMLADADRAFAGLIALSELLEATRGRAAAPDPLDRAFRVALARLGMQMERIAAALEGRAARQPPRLAVPLTRLRRRLAGGAEPTPRRHAISLLEQIAGWVEAATENIVRAGADGRLAEALERRPALVPEPGPQPWRELRANLSLDSLALRHAARFAITAALAVLVTNALGLTRGYWVTITAVTILQPYLSSTWQRAIERVAGSVLGGVLAAAALLVLHSPSAVALLIVPLSVLTLAVRGVNFGLFILFLTPQFVLVAELFQGGGAADPSLAGERALDSVIGGALGLAAAFVLWPSWEAPHVRGRLAAAVRANRDYLLAALDLRAGRATAAALEEARRRAGLASNNAEASLQRLAGEPRKQAADETGPGIIVIAATRRLAGVAATLAVLPPEPGADAAETAEMRDWLADGLAAVAESIDHGVPAPPLPPAPQPPVPPGSLLAHELERARRQVSVLEDAASRLAAS